MIGDVQAIKKLFGGRGAIKKIILVGCNPIGVGMAPLPIYISLK